MRGNGIFQQKIECSCHTLKAIFEMSAIVASGDKLTSLCYKTTLPIMTQTSLQEVLRIQPQTPAIFAF
jgi:hypothetical protein